MQNNYKAPELQAARQIYTYLLTGQTEAGIELLRSLKDEVHAGIPARQRQSRGITWVVQRISRLFIAECTTRPQEIHILADILYKNLPSDDFLNGVPIFLMGEYGKSDPAGAAEFFLHVADADEWVLREFAQASFRILLKPSRKFALPWLKQTVQSDRPNLRRFVGETLRPVTENRWLNDEPETSLAILRLLFREPNPYPRTSVGNNLSDLSRRNPELILGIVRELVASGDKNSYWIAYRACRNMVKKSPREILDVLGVDEYHYKDRNFYKD